MPRLKTAQNSESRVLSRRVLMLVMSDMTAQMPRIMWQHEIPILEAVFGEGKVKPVDTSTLDEGYTGKVLPTMMPFNKSQDAPVRPSETQGIGWVFVGDPRAEYDRLATVYGRMPDEPRPVVEHVYGRFQEGRFSAVVGAAEVEDLPESQLRDLINGYGFIPVVAADSTDAEKQKAREKQVQLMKAERAELLTIAESLGVTLD